MDKGLTWYYYLSSTNTPAIGNWVSISIASNVNKAVAIDSQGIVYILSYKLQTQELSAQVAQAQVMGTLNCLQASAISSNGVFVFIVAYAGYIYISSNGGTSYGSLDYAGTWQTI